MGCPVSILRLDNRARARICSAGGHRLHRDAVLNRADIDAQIAGNAFFVDHAKGAVIRHGNRLMLSLIHI